MGSRLVSAIAFYGPKSDPMRGFLASVQALVAEHVGGGFRPYTLEQIHATLILLTGVPDPETGAIVNERALERTGVGRQMDLPRAMRILSEHLASPIRVRVGGHPRDRDAPFLSRGQHLFDRAFSAQKGDALVLVGWPAASLSGPGRPLNALRRDMNAANVFHRYHQHDHDVDDDLHLVVGHHAGAAPDALDRAVGAVRDMLAANPVDLAIGMEDVRVVAADSHTMAPARFVGGIPVDEATLRELMS